MPHFKIPIPVHTSRISTTVSYWKPVPHLGDIFGLFAECINSVHRSLETEAQAIRLKAGESFIHYNVSNVIFAVVCTNTTSQILKMRLPQIISSPSSLEIMLSTSTHVDYYVWVDFLPPIKVYERFLLNNSLPSHTRLRVFSATPQPAGPLLQQRPRA